jgi:hypothetical protein
MAHFNVIPHLRLGFQGDLFPLYLRPKFDFLLAYLLSVLRVPPTRSPSFDIPDNIRRRIQIMKLPIV